MSFFNEKWIAAMQTGNYICSECGGAMEFEDEWEETLVCLACGHEVDIERYGYSDDEEYDALYPTREEVMGDEDDEDDTGETYDEVYGELSRRLED
ncbi:hypothetical protein FACS189490_10570 [Clostridia bacterium]|nr:hypothetical protein FACS189490_10570 [Clostridia bacterium]